MHAAIVNHCPLSDALRHARTAGASDWHWSEDAQFLRVQGVLRELSDPPSWASLRSALPASQRAVIEGGSELDMSWTDAMGDRYRLQFCRTNLGISLTARIIDGALPDARACGIPDVARGWMAQRSGLVLIAGATGSGKSTSMAALILERARGGAQHVVTLEDPVEFLLKSEGSRYTQRAVGEHTESFAQGIRSAMRQDPDVIAIGELRDVESARWALLAAQTGHLVIASVHATDAVQTVQRVVSLFGADEQLQIRHILADTLNGVMVQELHAIPGGGRKASFEVMPATVAIRSLIREDRMAQIPGVIETSASGGMISMTQSRLKLQIGSVRT